MARPPTSPPVLAAPARAVVGLCLLAAIASTLAPPARSASPARPPIGRKHIPYTQERRHSGSPARPPIVRKHIPYGQERRHQMARYSRRHYGKARWRLRRTRVIVLHYTGGSSWQSAWNHFASNVPARGELPGVCAHYIVGKRGTIRSVVPLEIRCRHAIGLNHRSVGIEMVQEAGRGSHWAARRILRRRPQVRAALALVAWLQRRLGVRTRDVIGHAMANGSPYFEDLQGWRNDHVDWRRREVRVFRRRLGRVS
jgi:hypothetical protein